MAININAGFHLGAAIPLDDRAYLTKAQMLAVDENIYPDYFLTVCADDGFVYMFDKNMEAEEISAETGKFKLFAGDVEEAIRILNADEYTENSVRYWIKTLAKDADYENKETVIMHYDLSPFGLTDDLVLSAEQATEITAHPDFKFYVGDNEDGERLYMAFDDTGDKYGNPCYYIVKEDDTELGSVENLHFEDITIEKTIKEKIEEIEEAAEVTIEVAPDEETTEGYLKTYIFKQGDEEIGKVDIPKDLVVRSGSIVKITPVIDPDTAEVIGFKVDDAEEITYTAEDVVNEESDYYGYPTVGAKYIKLVIANQKAPIFIDIKEIMPEGAGEVTEDIVANVEVGGIAVGDTVEEGTDLTEFVKQLLVKYFPPKITIDGSVSNKVQRVGTVLNNVVLTAVAEKQTDDITSIVLDGDEDTEDVAEGKTVTKTIDEISTTTEFTASASDGKNVTSTKVKYEFVLPYMHGVSDKNVIEEDADLEALTEVVEKSGNKTFAYTAPNKYCVFVMPAEYADLKSILDPSSFENLGSWTKSTYTNEAGEAYKVYVTNTKVTCTNFKYTFK